MKVVTICGSMKFAKEMQRIAGVLAIDKGWCILQCVYDLDFANLTSEDLNLLKNEHLKRIELSDAIYVVNIDGYIGNSTRLEIEYATKLGKEVIYHDLTLLCEKKSNYISQQLTNCGLEVIVWQMQKRCRIMLVTMLSIKEIIKILDV